jgi:outer membrane protein OmpU
MRKALLGTTALVAAGVIGAPAAEAAFDVQVHGNYTAAYASVDEDDDFGEAGYKRQNQTLNQDAEVHFRFMQTFDNGLTAGGRVELEGATHNEREAGPVSPVNSRTGGTDQIDEKWGYVKGGFGELRFGDEDDARKLLAVYAPYATIIFSVNSPYWTFNNPAPGQAATTNTTAPFLENDSAKIIYFTPSFGGFQLAASYTPDSTQDRAQGGTGGTDEAGQFSNVLSAAGQYNGKFGDVTVQGSAGVTKGYSEVRTLDDPIIWEAGLVLGFGAFRIGSTVGMGDDLAPGSTWNAAGATEALVYEIGGTYTMGATTVGLAWSHGEYEQTDGEEDANDHIQLGLGHKLGEGVEVGAFVGLFEYDDEGAADSDNSGWQTGLGINMFF